MKEVSNFWFDWTFEPKAVRLQFQHFQMCKIENRVWYCAAHRITPKQKFLRIDRRECWYVWWVHRVGTVITILFHLKPSYFLFSMGWYLSRRWYQALIPLAFSTERFQVLSGKLPEQILNGNRVSRESFWNKLLSTKVGLSYPRTRCCLQSSALYHKNKQVRDMCIHFDNETRWTYATYPISWGLLSLARLWGRNCLLLP